MLDLIYREVEQIANLQIFGILFLLFLACSSGFQGRQKTIGSQIVTFDARFWYTPQQGQELLEQMGARGRKIYAITQITLDLLFPLVYGSLLLILIFAYRCPKFLLLLPVITASADLIENLTTAYLALSYKGTSSSITRIAAIFTAAKRIGLCLSALAILYGAIMFYLR